MSDFIITSFFKVSGVPKLGLVPIIRIWEVDSGSNTLVVNNDNMSEVGDGFYKYVFTTYDANKEYLVRADGGPTMPLVERFSPGSINNLDDKDALVDAIYEEPFTGHTTVGSYGLQFSQTKNNTDQLVVDVGTLISMVEFLTKFETNRTVINPTLKTLTVYDDDEVTPIAEFYLRDEFGVLNIERVFERDPI